MDLWGDFTGDSQRRDIRRGETAQINALMAGADQAGTDLSEGYSRSQSMLDPFIASGRGHQQMLDDLMNINGPEARARAQQMVSSDPLWQGQLAAGQNAALRSLNARGMSGSGAMALAGQRVLTERYGDVLNRYQQQGQQGQQASALGADLASRYGSERAGLTYGNAQQMAGVHGATANALSASRGTFMNNLMGLGSLAVGAFTPGFGGVSAAGNMGRAMSGGMNKLWGAGAG